MSRIALMTALYALLIGMATHGCGDISGESARVRVVMSGVTTQTNAVEIHLVPGIYNFVATGNADADSADITLQVFDWQAVEQATIPISLPLADANAAPGDTGSGKSTGVQVVAGMQSVTIDFHWQGTTPTASAGVHLNFFDNPDIWSWGAAPNAPAKPGTSVSVWVEATNNEGPQDKLTVESQFIDALAGSVINTVTLAFVGGLRFEGEIEAPGYPGAHGLRIVATDNVDGITQHERTYTVQ